MKRLVIYTTASTISVAVEDVFANGITQRMNRGHCFLLEEVRNGEQFMYLINPAQVATIMITNESED